MIRLALRVRRAQAELALAELLELVPRGVEEVDRGDVVEYAVYGAPGELPELPDLEAAVGGGLVEVVTSEVPDDWAERWRRFHKPLLVGGRIFVRPPWEPPHAEQDVIDVAIDPGRAFGTGSHATTRLSLELLLELEPAGPLADLGCGSGVLAIAAAKLGWAPVLALDNDPVSVEATRANAHANGVQVEVRRADLRRDGAPGTATLVANLVRPLLLELAPRLGEPPRSLIASGLLEEEADEVEAAFSAAGLAARERRVDAGWAALLMSQPSSSETVTSS